MNNNHRENNSKGRVAAPSSKWKWSRLNERGNITELNNWIILSFSSLSSHFSYSDAIFRFPSLSIHTFHPEIFTKYKKIYTRFSIDEKRKILRWQVRKYKKIYTKESGIWKSKRWRKRIFKEEEGINFLKKKKKESTNPISFYLFWN